MYLCYDSYICCYTDHFDWQGEGVAYRGRALVEIQTTLGELPEVPVEEINNDDILRVQVSPPGCISQLKNTTYLWIAAELLYSLCKQIFYMDLCIILNFLRRNSWDAENTNSMLHSSMLQWSVLLMLLWNLKSALVSSITILCYNCLHELIFMSFSV